MSCTNCGHRNPEGAKFCSNCGHPMARLCPNGHANPPDARFCMECGAEIVSGAERPVEAQASSGTALDPNLAIQDAEKRQMTVLFADLVGSTALSADVDAEDYREVIARYIVVVEEAIERFGGHVANYLGDGVLAYFGYPRAHEDDALRGCLAALEIIGAVDNLGIQVGSRDKLSVRVGIHTGTTVIGTVGEGNAREVMAVGETLNMAARLQSVAEPDRAVISGATQQLVARAFELEDLGLYELKGIPGEVPVYCIVRALGLADRVAATEDELPLVGRDSELHVLRQRWEESRSGTGRVVVLRAEAGLGKSRLVRALEQEVGIESANWLKARATSFYADTALRPIADVLPGVIGVDPDGAEDDLLAAADRWLADLGMASDENTALVAGVLGIEPGTETYDPLAYSPQIIRQKTLDLLADVFVTMAHREPFAFIIEAVHWADQTTLDLVDLLSGRAHEAPLMVVLSGRPAFEAPWVVDSELVLRRLPTDQVAELISHITGGKHVPDLVTKQITDKADGNPLYVEELTRNVLESGLLREIEGGRYEVVGEPDSLSIPASLRELLMARLDRSATSRTVIQLAATIGRAFPYDVVASILEGGELDLADELGQLVRTGLLFQRGSPPDASYTFRHALLHDAAYDSMTRKTRARYHDRIAEILRGDEDTPPEIIAHHLSASGKRLESVPYWIMAGQEALGSFALTESMNHLHRALSMLEGVDAPADEIVASELAVRTLLGVPLMLTQGFASEGVAENYGRVLELSEEAGEDAAQELFPALWGLWTYYEVGAQLARAEEIGERLLSLADASRDSGIELAANVAYGAARLVRGDVESARHHFERGLEVYQADVHAPLAMLFGQDGGAMCCSFLTWVHAHEGDIERGMRRAAESIEMCRKLDHLSTTGFVEAVLASFYCLIGDYETGEQHAQTVAGLGRDQGMPHWAAQGEFNLGWALEGQGSPAESLEHFERGAEGFAMTGTRVATTYFRGALVEALIQLGDLDRARSELDDLFAFMEESDERFYEAELRRLGGEIALRRGDAEGAERAFGRAAEIAEQQGAAGFAERARRSLAELSATN